MNWLCRGLYYSIASPKIEISIFNSLIVDANNLGSFIMIYTTRPSFVIPMPLNDKLDIFTIKA